MKTKIKLATIFLLFISVNLFAQNNESQKTSLFQASLAYPIGSNGLSSMDYSNKFSLNILYGLNGGLNGVEIGSILNYNKGDVRGFQLSGVSNFNTGYSRGFLLSGVSTMCLDSASGLFISGVLNYTNQNLKGFQLATVNIANDISGFQLGVFNYARKLKGAQLGVINILNNGTEGLPIGLFSIVKNGYFELEFTGGEVIYANLNYKMGVEKLYSIYKAGYSSFKNNPVYSVGFGFGSNVFLSDKHGINIDVTSNSIAYNNKWNSKLNLLNKVDLNYKFHVSEKLSLLIGPSINLYVTKEKVDNEFGTLNIPYSVYTHEWSGGKVQMWFGLNAGLALKL